MSSSSSTAAAIIQASQFLVSNCASYTRPEFYYTLTQDCSVNKRLSTALFTLEILLFVALACVSAYNLHLQHQADLRQPVRPKVGQRNDTNAASAASNQVSSPKSFFTNPLRFLQSPPTGGGGTTGNNNATQTQKYNASNDAPMVRQRTLTQTSAATANKSNPTRQLITASRCFVLLTALLHSLHCCLLLASEFNSSLTYPGQNAASRLLLYALPLISWQMLSLLFTLILFRLLLATRLKGAPSRQRKRERWANLVVLALVCEVTMLNLICLMHPITQHDALSTQQSYLRVALAHYGVLSLLCSVSTAALGRILSLHLLASSRSAAVGAVAHRLRRASALLALCYVVIGVVLLLLASHTVELREFYFHIIELLNGCMMLCILYFLRTSGMAGGGGNAQSAAAASQHQANGGANATSASVLGKAGGGGADVNANGVHYAVNTLNANSSHYLATAATQMEMSVTGQATQLSRLGSGQGNNAQDTQQQGRRITDTSQDLDCDAHGIRVEAVKLFQDTGKS